MIFSQLAGAAVTAVALFTTTGSTAPGAGLTALEQRQNPLKFDFGGTKIRGVNLGGWFVLEPWINTKFFEATPDDVVDEYTFGKVLGRAEAESRLEGHWSSFITAADFAKIKSKGLNFVRIPIGYWSILPIDGEPYAHGAYKYLGQALDWANDNGLKVMIDLHGAPRSQNGFDNSGQRGSVGWTQGNSVDHTLKTLNKLRDDHASHPAVASIELLNEPLGPSLNMDTVRQFMMDGWGNLKGSSVAVAFHDAFQGVTSWNNWGDGMWSLLLDTHHYEIFDSGALQMSIDDHVSTACGFGGDMASNNKWTISGEWTGAVTDCTKWLNGRGVGARYDGTYQKDGQGSSYIGSCDRKYEGTPSGLNDIEKKNLQRFITAQIVAFEKADGWIFWTWKTASSAEWDFEKILDSGLIDLNNIDYSVCG